MGDSESTLHSWPSLLMRLRDAADGSAWRTFVASYAPLLYQWCIRKGLQDADAADVSQEALRGWVRLAKRDHVRAADLG